MRDSILQVGATLSVLRCVCSRARAICCVNARWGLQTVNVANCSKQGGAGCEQLLAGSIDVAVRTAKLLNANQKVPMYANPGSFIKPATQNIWMNESRLVEALAGTSWMTCDTSAYRNSTILL